MELNWIKFRHLAVFVGLERHYSTFINSLMLKNKKKDLEGSFSGRGVTYIEVGLIVGFGFGFGYQTIFLNHFEPRARHPEITNQL